MSQSGGGKRDNAVAFFSIGGGGFCDSVSPRLAAWLKCHPDDLLGHGWTNFVHPDDQYLARRAIDVLQTGECPEPYRQRCVTEDYEVIVVRITLWLWVASHGAARRIVGHARHLTEEEYGDVAGIESGTNRDENLRDRAAGRRRRATIERYSAAGLGARADRQASPAEALSV